MGDKIPATKNVKKGKNMLKPDINSEYLERPYAVKYAELELTKPAEEIMLFLNKKEVIDPSLALLPENGNMEEILNEGYMQCEYGYCTLPNGGGYIAMLNKMPGVTYEMYKFFCEWWGNAPDATLRYRIWNPQDHIMAGYRWTCEAIGDHIEDLVFLEKLKIQNLGISSEKAASSTLICPDGGNVVSKRIDAPPFSSPVPGVVCHFVREMADGSGIELRSRFWKGYQAGEKGLFNAMGPYTPKETPESLHALAEHNAYEMAHLAAILPSLYDEEKHSCYY